MMTAASDDNNNDKNTLFHYTIGRSGSTMISQILKNLFSKDYIVRCGHENYPVTPQDKLVITYRDFRDVMFSFWRVYQDIPFEELDKGRQMTIKEVEKYTCLVAGMANGILRKTREKHSNPLLIKYEDFVNNYEYIFSKLEKHFEINIPQEKREELINRFGKKANKTKSAHLKSFKKVTKDLVHGLHVYKGEVGIWKKYVPKEKHKYVNDKLSRALREWGYK